MDGYARVSRSATIDLRIGLLLDGCDNDGEPLPPRRIQQQERESTVTGDETELHHGRLLVLSCFIKFLLGFVGPTQGLQNFRMELQVSNERAYVFLPEAGSFLFNPGNSLTTEVFGLRQVLISSREIPKQPFDSAFC